MSAIAFVPTQRGGTALIFDGYRYNKVRCNNDKNVTYWRCSKNRNCPGRAVTVDNRVKKTNNKHNHPPEAPMSHGHHNPFLSMAAAAAAAHQHSAIQLRAAATAAAAAVAAQNHHHHHHNQSQNHHHLQNHHNHNPQQQPHPPLHNNPLMLSLINSANSASSAHHAAILAASAAGNNHSMLNNNANLAAVSPATTGANPINLSNTSSTSASNNVAPLPPTTFSESIQAQLALWSLLGLTNPIQWNPTLNIER